MKPVWIVPNIGLVEKTGDKSFNNDTYVGEIHADSTPMGNLMRLSYPTTTNIKIVAETPPHWVQWEPQPLNTLGESITHAVMPEEIPGDTRLWVPRGEQSQRTRSIARAALFHTTPRGIVDKGIPHSIEENFASIIYGLYMLVEKNTVASIKDKKKTSVSGGRMKKMLAVADIIVQRENIVDVCLVSGYTEPSSTLMQRIYYMAGVYGVNATKKAIDDVYFTHFEEQAYSVEEMMSIMLGS